MHVRSRFAVYGFAHAPVRVVGKLCDQGQTRKAGVPALRVVDVVQRVQLQITVCNTDIRPLAVFVVAICL